MISITELKSYMAAYPEQPPRTTALEQRIRIGTGFHDKWYRSQREHMLGWMVVQECQARMKGKDPMTVDAKGMWGRLKCSPAMFWLAESAGVHNDILEQAEKQAEAAARLNPMDGDPHGRMMRQILPWDVIREAIQKGRMGRPAEEAELIARDAFDRLTRKVSNYRKYRNWLPATL